MSREDGSEADAARRLGSGMRRVGSFFLADSAVVVGAVEIEADVGIWHHCVVRGDVAPIRIGQRSNIQDGSILHCRHGVPLEIGPHVTVGHGAVVHCRRVGARTLIGIRACVLDDCEVGEECIIAAGAVVPPGTSIPDRSVVMGVPGQLVRAVRPEELEYVRAVGERYVELARAHARGEYPPVESDER